MTRTQVQIAASEDRSRQEPGTAVCRRRRRSAGAELRRAAVALLLLVLVAAAAAAASDKSAASKSAAELSPQSAEMPAELFDRDARAPRPKFIRFGRAGQKFIRFGRSSWSDGDENAWAPAPAADAAPELDALPLRRYFFVSPKRAQKFIRFG